MLYIVNYYMLHLSVLFCICVLSKIKLSFNIFIIALIGLASLFINFYSDNFLVVFSVVKTFLEITCIYNNKIKVKNIMATVVFLFAVAFAELKGTVCCAGLSMLCFIIASVCLIFRRLKTRSFNKTNMTVITSRGKRTVRVLADSGNMLRDPIKGLPVIIVAIKDLIEIIPLSVLYVLGISSVSDFDKVYLVPYKTIAQEGVLYGFEPDECIIKGIAVDCIIAVSEKEGKFGGDCSALCNPEVWEV